MASSVIDGTLKYVEMFEKSEMASDSARVAATKARDYFDNKQWTEAEAKELARRGQPVITDNVIAGKINWLLGQEMSQRTDPKAYPRTPQHEQGAEAVTDAVRYVCDKEEWSRTRSRVWKNMLVEGFGGVEVIHKMRPPKNEPDIIINQYEWDRLFYDPHSREDDFSDATYKGAVIWANRDKVIQDHPDSKDAIEGTIKQESSIYGDTYDDKPTDRIWADKEGNRIRIVLMYYLEDGVWKWVKFTEGYVFDEGESPYKDDEDNSICPLIMQSAYVDREGNRYGEVHKMIDQQDEINKRRSKLLHFANSRQTMSIKGAVDNVAALKRELAKPDGHVEYHQMDDTTRPSFDIIQTRDMTSSQFALLQEAKESIQGMGATEALMGSADGDSGRAVLAKQQGAAQALTPLSDKLHHFTRNVYEAVWFCIRQFWTAEKWVRVTDDERNVRFVALNKPVTLRDKLKEMPEEQVRQVAMQMQLVPNDPRLDAVLEVENQIEGLDVDLIMEEVPDTVTLDAENFEQLVNIDQAKGGILPLEMLIEASPLRSDIKNKILDHFEEQKQAQQQGQGQDNEIQQAAIKLEMAERQAAIEKTQTEAAKNVATIQKTGAETRRLNLGY